jgi:hypothetical protein
VTVTDKWKQGTYRYKQRSDEVMLSEAKYERVRDRKNKRGEKE